MTAIFTPISWGAALISDFFFTDSVLPATADDFTNSLRRKRIADQSSSIATMRTVSKPAASIACQPLSRLNSHL